MFSQGRRMLKALNINAPSSATSTTGVRKRSKEPFDFDDDASLSSFNSTELRALNPKWVKEMQLQKKKTDKKTEKADQRHAPRLVAYSSSSSNNALVHSTVEGSASAKKVIAWLFQSDKLDDSINFTNSDEITSEPGLNEDAGDFLSPVIANHRNARHGNGVLAHTVTASDMTTSKTGHNEEITDTISPVIDAKETDENGNDAVSHSAATTTDMITSKTGHNEEITHTISSVIDAKETDENGNDVSHSAATTTDMITSKTEHNKTTTEVLSLVRYMDENQKYVAPEVNTSPSDEITSIIERTEDTIIHSPVIREDIDNNLKDGVFDLVTPILDKVTSKSELHVQKRMQAGHEKTPGQSVGCKKGGTDDCCLDKDQLPDIQVSKERSRSEQPPETLKTSCQTKKSSATTKKNVRRNIFFGESVSNGHGDTSIENLDGESLGGANTENLRNVSEITSLEILQSHVNGHKNQSGVGRDAASGQANDTGDGVEVVHRDHQAVEIPLNDHDDELRNIIDSGISDDIQGTAVVIPLMEPIEEVIVISNNSQKRTRKNNHADTPVTKKRKLNPTKWQAAEAKRAHNLGLAHVSLRGNHVKAKDLRAGCSNACKQNCKGRLSIAARKNHNKLYWGLGDKLLQWLHVARLVQVKKIDDKRRKKKLGDGDVPYRVNSYVYHLLDENGEPVKVCQTMFLNTLAISVSVVKNAFRKNSPDKRGKHGTRRKMSAALIETVKTHIKSFPMVESHYCRVSTSRRYLDEHLNVAKMHRLYLLLHREGNPETAKLRQYRDIFNAFFNLGFFKPKKDQCFTCVAWNTLSEEEKLVERDQGDKYLQHIQSKITARNLKKEDKNKSRLPESKTVVVCYDLQKVFFAPKTEIGDLFYKCKLACYNFTMFDITKRKATCYVWDQTVAGRGADEMSSFVFNFIGETVSDNISEIIFWSDSCFAQNKNQFLLTMYYVAAMKFKIRIVHRYLEKGHTQMEADSVHARIERKIKNEDIFTPKQWFGHIMTAKVRRPQYKVVQVTQGQVVSFRDTSEKHFSWKKVPVSKIKEIVLDSSKPGTVFYKCELDEEATECAILKPRVGRPINWSTLTLKPTYDGPIPMKANLKQHLQWMLDKGYIPNCHIADFQSKLLVQGQAAAAPEDEDEPEELVPHDIQVDQIFIEPDDENNIDDDLDEIDAPDEGSGSEISDDSDSE